MKTIKDNATTSMDIDRAYNDHKYIVSFKTVYQPFYSVNAGYYANAVYHSNEKLTMPGRFFHMTGDAINRMINHALLNNL